MLTKIRQNGRVNVGAFYVRRILRIWPLCFLLPVRLYKLVPALFIVISIASATVIGSKEGALYHSSFTRIGEIATGAFLL